MMRLARLFGSCFVGLAATAVSAFVAGSCSSETPPASDGCSINSDCNDPLVCAFRRCHKQCTASRDCPPGARCVEVLEQGTGARLGSVCQLPDEAAAACLSSLNCPGQEICGVDARCRDQCDIAADCIHEQLCVSRTCADPLELGDAGVLPVLIEGGYTRSGEPLTGSKGPGRDADSSVNDASMMGAGGAAGAGGSGGAGGVTGAGGSNAGDSGKSTVVLGFAPSNFDFDQASLGADAGASIDAGTLPAIVISKANCGNDCLPPPIALTLGDGSPADLYMMRSLRIDTTAALNITGPHPIVLAVLDTVDVQGTVSVGANQENGGPGGFSYNTVGPGSGGAGASASAPGSGGGGGSYCGSGGRGGTTGGATAAPGKTYGTAEIAPLVGGSPGGNPTYGRGGGGGGALQLVARTSINLGSFGIIYAGGGGGNATNPAAGGGSGGAILLEAPTITIGGHLAANGGGGGGDMTAGDPASTDDQPAAGGTSRGGSSSKGDVVNASDGTTGPYGTGGGGGAGRIRINTSTGAPMLGPGAIISPSFATPCATKGKLTF